MKFKLYCSLGKSTINLQCYFSKSTSTKHIHVSTNEGRTRRFLVAGVHFILFSSGHCGLIFISNNNTAPQYRRTESPTKLSHFNLELIQFGLYRYLFFLILSTVSAKLIFFPVYSSIQNPSIITLFHLSLSVLKSRSRQFPRCHFSIIYILLSHRLLERGRGAWKVPLLQSWDPFCFKMLHPNGYLNIG